MKIKLLNGKILEHQGQGKLGEVIQNLQLREAVIGGVLNGELIDLQQELDQRSEIELVTIDSEKAQKFIWHSLAHIMAHAVKNLFPEAKLGIGPAIEEGFYYDFDLDHRFSPEDLERISQEMRKIIEADYKFERIELSKEEARQLLKEGNEIYKLEILEELEEAERISFYKDGEFIDLCRGPHLPSTGLIKYFKLEETAGAYWRGDESRKMLQRIYGTAFYREEELELYLKRREEAAKRDHRKLGEQLDLFSIHEEGGSGLILWHPRGGRMRKVIEDFWREEHYKAGYEIVYTPHIGRAKLWETSGHLDFYRESMYAPMEIEGQNFYLKPMNCPFHIMIYKDKTRSYRDLPLKFAELGTVYRYERSGVLHGLMRVRGFTQDDAHIFCRPDQVEDEILNVLDFSFFMLTSFGFKDYEIALSVRDPLSPEKYAGVDRDWQMATSALQLALQTRNLPYKRLEGEAVFYGPKIDIKIKDALGRSWQCTTIQFDFNLPQRFDLTYIGKDGRKERPYMIHRTLLGSMERFFGVLIEHYAGAFPAWLAPIQAVVLPVTEHNLEYAEQVCHKLTQEGIRAEVDGSSHTLSYRIRQAQLQKIPYMLVVGKKEEEKNQVALRLRTEEDLGPKDLEEFIKFIREKIKNKEEL